MQRKDSDTRSRVGSAGHARGEAAAYVLAVVAWAALGLVYKPILSMIVSPLWMVLMVVVLPRALGRLRKSPR